MPQEPELASIEVSPPTPGESSHFMEAILQDTPEYRVICAAAVRRKAALPVVSADLFSGTCSEQSAARSALGQVGDASEWREMIIQRPETTESALLNDRSFAVDDLVGYMKPAFQHIASLNPVQSSVLARALRMHGNVLVCAPTGSGKTDIAVALILRTLFEECGGELQEFKCVYIAPMRALVGELQRSLSARLRTYGILVTECTGEQRLSHRDLWRSHILVTTPEKWDVLTRRANERPLLRFLKIVIIDEIHVLDDPKRGPVLERCVARLHHETALFGYRVRLVGLSATLPNYDDVAVFIRARLHEGVFVFSERERPCPLELRLVALRHRVGLLSKTRFDQLMNHALWFQVQKFAVQQMEQVLVFVHERADTLKTAHWLLNAADGENAPILQRRETEWLSPSIREHFKNFGEILATVKKGIGVHHAGLPREIRHLMEQLFLQGSLRIMISTATLAWGVNLPANVVVIKGTQYYDSEEGQTVQLAPLHVLQMLGRAGRYPFHQRGVGVIITTEPEAPLYAAVVAHKAPIESHLIPQLADSLLAEVAGGSLSTVEEAAEWLKYTFLFVRMLQNPSLEWMPHFASKRPADGEDVSLWGVRLRLCHSVAKELARNELLRYGENLEMTVTARGNVASAFMLPYNTLRTIEAYLHPTSALPELIHLLAVASPALRNLSLPRESESRELRRFSWRLLIPLWDPDRDLKISALLQAAVLPTGLSSSPALSQDCSSILEESQRMLRAVHALSATLGMAVPMRLSLLLAKKLEHQQTRILQGALRGGSSNDQSSSTSSRMQPRKTHNSKGQPEQHSETEALRCFSPSVGDWMPPAVLCSALGRQQCAVRSWIAFESALLPVSADTLRFECRIALQDSSCIDSTEALWVSLEDATGERAFFAARLVLREAKYHLVGCCSVPPWQRTSVAFWRIAAEEHLVDDFLQAECLRDLPWPVDDNRIAPEIGRFVFHDFSRLAAACETLIPGYLKMVMDCAPGQRPGVLFAIPFRPERIRCLAACLTVAREKRLVCYVSPHRSHREVFRQLVQSCKLRCAELSIDPQWHRKLSCADDDEHEARFLIGDPKHFASLVHSMQSEQLRVQAPLWLLDDLESVSWDPSYEFLLMNLARAEQVLFSEHFQNVDQVLRWLGLDPSRMLQFEWQPPGEASPLITTADEALLNRPRLVAKRFWRAFRRIAPPRGPQFVAVCAVMRDALLLGAELARQSPYRSECPARLAASLTAAERALLERGIWLPTRSTSYETGAPPGHTNVRVVVIEIGELLLLPSDGNEYAFAFMVGNGFAQASSRPRENLFRWSCRYFARICRGPVSVLVPPHLEGLMQLPANWPPVIDSVADLFWELFIVHQVARGTLQTAEQVAELMSRTLYRYRYLQHTAARPLCEVISLGSELDRIALMTRLVTEKLISECNLLRIRNDGRFDCRDVVAPRLAFCFGIEVQTARTILDRFSGRVITRSALLDMFAETLVSELGPGWLPRDLASSDEAGRPHSLWPIRGPKARPKKVQPVLFVRTLLIWLLRSPPTSQFCWRRLLEELSGAWERLLPALVFTGLARLCWSAFRQFHKITRTLSFELMVSGSPLRSREQSHLTKPADDLDDAVGEEPDGRIAQIEHHMGAEYRERCTSYLHQMDHEQHEQHEQHERQADLGNEPHRIERRARGRHLQAKLAAAAAAGMVDSGGSIQSRNDACFHLHPQQGGSLRVQQAMQQGTRRKRVIDVHCIGIALGQRTEKPVDEHMYRKRHAWLVVRDAGSDTVVSADRVFYQFGLQRFCLKLPEVAACEPTKLSVHAFDEFSTDEEMERCVFVTSAQTTADPSI